MVEPAAKSEAGFPGWFVELEQEVLGAIMSRPDTLAGVVAELRPEHFIEPVPRVICAAIQTALANFNNTAVHLVNGILSEQEKEGFLAQSGSKLSTYLARLTAESVYGALGLPRTARAVIDQTARYNVMLEARALEAAAMDPNNLPGEIVSRSMSAFDEILTGTRRGARGRKTRVTVGAAIIDTLAAVEDTIVNGHKWTGVSWGLSDVDHATGGIQPRDLCLIGARPSIGKTTFALSVALKAAKKGKGVGIVSLEMDAEKLAARAASDLCYDWGVKVKYQDIIRRKIDQDQFDLIASAIREVAELPLWIEDQSGLSVADIRVKLEGLLLEAERAGTPLSMLMIDHLGLILPSDRYRENRAQQVGEMTAALKSMAREYDIAIVLLSQLNRGLEGRENKRPTLADLRDSGSIEQDADTVMFLYRDAYYLEREKGTSPERESDRINKLIDCQQTMELAIAKQRNGPVTTIELFADMPFSAIRNAAMGR